MNGKQQYENIPIPDTLDSVIDSAIRCAPPRVSPLWRVLAAAACFVLVLFGVANTPLYTYAADIPVIGGVVQVLRIGTGGEVTDGAELTAESEGGSVDLEFSGMISAPYFSVERFSAPDRAVITMHGVRFSDRSAVIESVEATEGVAGAYFSMILDDSMVQLVVELEPGFDCTITELSEPAALRIDFTGGGSVSEEPVWYLRSETMDLGEGLALLCEQYAQFDAQQVRTDSGRYAVVIGNYASEEEALAALAELPEDSGFYAESALPNERPAD